MARRGLPPERTGFKRTAPTPRGGRIIESGSGHPATENGRYTPGFPSDGVYSPMKSS